MSKINYLIVHKDHPLHVRGVNSGAEMATLFLARYLAREGNRVIVAAQLADGVQSDCGVEFWDLGPSFNVREILKRASALGPYHLISAGRSQPIFESQGDAHCCSRLLISHDRSGNDTGIHPKVLCRNLDQVICVSEAQRKVFLDAGAPPEKCVTIHNGVDHELFAASSADQRDFRRLVFVGALVQDKGIHLLINSFCNLKRKYTDLKLDIYGSADLWGRNEIVDPVSLEKQIPDLKFHGKVSQSEIAVAYQRAGICVVPSIWFDPFPLTSIEAQTTGCPVVTFDVGGLKEGVRHNESGIVLDDISEDALTRSLDELLSDPERIERMSQVALEKQRPYYDWKRVAVSVMKIAAQVGSEIKAPSAQVDDLTKKKLGVFTTWNQPCGLATYARYLVNEFEEGTAVILAEDTDSSQRELDEPWVERCWKRTGGDWRNLSDALKRHDVGLLHLNIHNPLEFAQDGFVEQLQSFRSGGGTVYLHLHSVYTIREEACRFFDSVDRIVVHSPEVRLEVISHGVAGEKVLVLPHGVDVQLATSSERALLRCKLGMSSDQKSVVSFGFIQPHKGIEGLIEGVAELSQAGENVHGYIVGGPNQADPNAESYLAQLKDLSTQSGVADRIHFLDRFLPRNEVTEYLQASDAVVMNYRTQHYEASGACSLAVGAGAFVAASTAPPFQAFGDAVWHITSGFPVSSSLRLLLHCSELQEAQRENIARYCAENSWKEIAQQLLSFYRNDKFEPSIVNKEIVVETQSKSNSPAPGSSPLRVLIRNRANMLSQRGGDTVVIEKLLEGLRRNGIDAVLDLELQEDPSKFDLVHLINFALPPFLEQAGKQALQAGTPFVVTTLCEDIPHFHNQSIQVANTLVEYVQAGQQNEWFDAHWKDLSRIPACEPFQNSWTASNASALIANGNSEAEVVRATYQSDTPVHVIPVGHDFGAEADPELFVHEYGVREFVFCVGRFESRKNQLMLLKALEDLELPVVLASGGFSYQPQYDRAVRHFVRKGKTLVLEQVSTEMLASAYAAAKVHALPSWYELPGLVSLEAAFHGCNVVAADNGTARNYLSDFAFYCDPGCEESIRNAVLAAYYCPQKAGFQEHVSQYTWDRSTQSTIELYHKILGKSAPAENALADSIPSAEHPVFDSVIIQGENAAREKDFVKARELLDQAEEMQPNSARVFRARGAIAMAEDNQVEAERYFQKGYELDSKDPKILSGLGMSFMMRGAHDQAYDLFLKALSYEPFQMVAILQLLDCSYVLNRFEDLERVLRKFLDHQPENSDMRFCLAGCLYRLGEHEKAQKEAEAVQREEPTHQGAAELLTKLKEEQSSINPKSTQGLQSEIVTEAIDQFIAERERPFDSLAARVSELEEYKRRKQYDELLEGCDEVLSSAGIEASCREIVSLLKGEALALTGKIEEAVEIFQPFVALRNPRAICGVGAVKASQESWNEAQQCFEQALEVKPGYDVALAGLGVCESQTGDRETAWQYFLQANKANPENTRALLGIIQLGYELKRLDQVQCSLEQYLDIYPADLDFLYSLAGCLFAQGRLQEAQSEVEKITLFDPENSNAVELRSMIDERLNQSAIPVG